MRRIMIQRQSVLFVNHGQLSNDKDKDRLTMAVLGNRSSEPEDQMFISVNAGEIKDVPDWCAFTKTWKDHEADENLVELLIKPASSKIEVPKSRVRVQREDAPLGLEAPMREPISNPATTDGSIKRPRTKK